MQRLDRILTSTARSWRSIHKPAYPRAQHWVSTRRYSSESSYSQNKSTNTEPKPVSPHIAFYMSFGKPIATVLAITGATYVGLYFLKQKLQNDEDKLQGSKGTNL
ncbi:hypothetical protein V1520DRAFT_362070 [Lipomyces starkeyi]|uniref:Uncharacterized protein n=1 Tax=Lipomyces starkeyi NRRL Y-11557 TaxID=675824 RepID=A0A1E3PZN5_LIPST|nr:hypothetical protein LIPSTDRAFT_106796 [Lipomyces starkeyi NRRL Y-11557]